MSSSKRVNVPIFSKAYVEAVGPEEASKKPVFTGPYRIVEYRPGTSIKLEAAGDTHWRVVPEYRYMEFLEVPEETTRLAMFRRGDVDIVETSADAAAKLQSGGEGTIVRVERGQVLQLSLFGQWLPDRALYDPNCPFLDKRVREALALAIDTESIAKVIFGGNAQRTGSVPNTPWNEEFAPYPYDPTRAKELLKEAGYGKGFSVELFLFVYGTQASEMKDVLLAVAGYWDAIGVNTKLNEQGLTILRALPTRDVPCKQGGGFTMGCPFQPWEQYFLANFHSASRGLVHYESPELDAILDQTQTVPVEERPELVKKAMQYIYDEYVVIPLVAGDKLWVKGKNVGEWETIKFQPMDLLLEYVQHPTPLNTFRLFEP